MWSTSIKELMEQKPRKCCSPKAKCFEPREDINVICQFLEEDMKTCKKTEETVAMGIPCPLPTETCTYCEEIIPKQAGDYCKGHFYCWECLAEAKTILSMTPEDWKEHYKNMDINI